MNEEEQQDLLINLWKAAYDCKSIGELHSLKKCVELTISEGWDAESPDDFATSYGATPWRYDEDNKELKDEA
jgi:hypothetical protein